MHRINTRVSAVLLPDHSSTVRSSVLADPAVSSMKAILILLVVMMACALGATSASTDDSGTTVETHLLHRCGSTPHAALHVHLISSLSVG